MSGSWLDGVSTLVIGATGSVGVMDLHRYIYLLRRAVAGEVHLMLSRSAQRFVTPYGLGLWTETPVLTDPFEAPPGMKVPHIELAARADLLLVMPASANILARCAHGLAEDLISTTVLACEAPVVFVPAMNGVMWRSRATQDNVARLRALGRFVLEPAEGLEIATFEPTFGVMPPGPALLRHLEALPISS
jgi:phosphopantothenoylcysteine synthetase/decarboxylase